MGFLAVDGFGGTTGAPLGTGGRLLGTTGVAAGIARVDASYRPTFEGKFADANPSFLCGAESDLKRLDLGDEPRPSLDVASRCDDSACLI